MRTTTTNAEGVYRGFMDTGLRGWEGVAVAWLWGTTMMVAAVWWWTGWARRVWSRIKVLP